MSTNHVRLFIKNFTVTMDCLPANTSLAYKWIKRDGMLPRKVIGKYTPHLIIPNVRVSDAGEYRCQLANASGFIYSNFEHLEVKGTNVLHIQHMIIYHNHTIFSI